MRNGVNTKYSTNGIAYWAGSRHAGELGKATCSVLAETPWEHDVCRILQKARPSAFNTAPAGKRRSEYHPAESSADHESA